jgi:hypothetical protein
MSGFPLKLRRSYQFTPRDWTVPDLLFQNEIDTRGAVAIMQSVAV